MFAARPLAVGESRRQVVIGSVIALAGCVFGLVGGLGLVDDVLGNLVCLLAHPLRGPVRAPGGVRGDLGAIDGDHADLDHASVCTQPQHLREQALELLGMLGPETGDRGVVRSVLAAQHPERDVIDAETFNSPRGPFTDRVGVDQQRQQHVRVIPLPPDPAGTTRRLTWVKRLSA